jgi:hypothetical protein
VGAPSFFLPLRRLFVGIYEKKGVWKGKKIKIELLLLLHFLLFFFFLFFFKKKYILFKKRIPSNREKTINHFGQTGWLAGWQGPYEGVLAPQTGVWQASVRYD